jgi:hypothetical protein
MQDSQQHHDPDFSTQRHSGMKWFQAIAGALVITGASLHPALAVTFHRMTIKPRLPRLTMPVPRTYSLHERAIKLQHLLHLATPPTLGKPISLGPAKPVIPGLADIEFESVFHIQASLQRNFYNGISLMPLKESNSLQPQTLMRQKSWCRL